MAQIPVVKGNVVENLSNHLIMIAQSSLYGANVVVFPELSLTGYELELAQELAFSPQSPHFSTLSRASIENDIVVIAGCPLNIKNSAKPTIGTVICFPDGTIEFYSKQYLHEGKGRFARQVPRTMSSMSKVIELGLPYVLISHQQRIHSTLECWVPTFTSPVR